MLTIIENRDLYLIQVIEIISEELDVQTVAVKESSCTKLALSVIYGLLQSLFLPYTNEHNTPLLKDLLLKAFDLMLLMSYKYTQYTFMVFRILTSFKKICQYPYKIYVFDDNNKNKLLNLVCHNWENPITGIRDFNKKIFEMILLEIDNLCDVVKEINDFPWNKAKYLMLSEIITQENGSVISLLKKNPQWVHGVIDSLYKPGLVSAGADMYYAIIKKVTLKEEFSSIFLPKILLVLTTGPFKVKENFHNYWCLNTLKLHPCMMIDLLNSLITPDNRNIYVALSIIKQSKKLGMLNINWDVSNNNYMNMLFYGTKHLDPFIRMLAFDSLCLISGTGLPTEKEYDLIFSFLIENINSDCTVLRIGIINSFRLFLQKLHTNFIYVVKQGHNISNDQLFKFCDNIQTLIVNSMTIKGNYQRKITVLKICDTVLSSFCKIHGKKNVASNMKTLMQTLKDVQMWHLNEENFVKTLLRFLEDPSDDIRDIIVQILIKYYSVDLIKLKIVDHIIRSAFTFIKSKFFYEINCGHSMFKLTANLMLKFKISVLEFENLEALFHFIFSEFISEYKAKSDIVSSIERGKQLHAFVTLLLTLLLVCMENNYPTESMLEEKSLNILLEALRQISHQFTGEEIVEISSDFSELSNLVIRIIEESGGGSDKDNKDPTKISGMQQIVLNAMWFNVKVLIEYMCI